MSFDFTGYCKSCNEDKKLGKKTVKIKSQYPAGVERSLNKEVREQMLALNKVLEELIRAELARMPRNDSLARSDGYMDRLTNFFDALSEKVKTPKKYDQWYQEFAEKIQIWNTKKFTESVNDELGVDFYLPNSKVSDEMVGDWVTANYQVIERYGQDTISKIREQVTREYMQGQRATEIEAKIAGFFDPDIAKKKAKIWSRNEVANLNSNLTTARQKELGIDMAMWSTSGDERVRCQHRGYDGKTYPVKEGITRQWLQDNKVAVTCSGTVNVKQSDGSFKSKSVSGDRGKEIDYYGGAIWAGTPINCRCVAISVIELDDVAEYDAKNE